MNWEKHSESCMKFWCELAWLNKMREITERMRTSQPHYQKAGSSPPLHTSWNCINYLGFLETNLNPRTILQRHLLQGKKLLQPNTVLAAGKINVLEFLTVLGNVFVQELAWAVGHLSYDEKLSRNLAQEIAKNWDIALLFKGLSKAF